VVGALGDLARLDLAKRPPARHDGAVPDLDLDWRLRLAAFDALRAMREARGGVVRLADLERGFLFEAERIPLINARRGIWRPRQLGADGAALSVVTTPPKAGKTPPYDDQVGSDEGWFVYRPIFPCYVAHDDPRELAFYLEADVSATRPIVSEEDFVGGAPRRAYATTTVKVRLHQRRFRELVVAAYRERCTVCGLRHTELLDAAHILPDRDQRGRPEVPNGLSLCKIHHGAFDAEILGVDPAYRIHIRRDVLDEHDGPMLLHGLQEMHSRRILLPSRDTLRPNPEYLEERFERFKAA